MNKDIQLFKPVALLFSAVLLSGCFPENNNDTPTPQPPITSTEVAVSVNAVYGEGNTSVIDSVTGVATNGQGPTLTSDLSLVTYGEHFYRLERFGSNKISKFHISDANTAIWEYSTDEIGDTESNPYKMIFVSENKAYLLRYGSPHMWIVNPQAASQADFKIGSIDLSAEDTTDGIPEMTDGTIINGTLYIVIQRMNSNTSPQTPQIATLITFDTDTNAETDRKDLSIKNPMTIQYLSTTNELFIQGLGKYEGSWLNPVTPAEYTGGIIAVELTSGNFNITTIVEDGDATTHPYGQVSNMQIVSDTKGYFIGYAGWGNNTLYSFDPSTGVDPLTATGGIATAVASIPASINIRDLALDSNNNLWVASEESVYDSNWSLVSSNVGIYRIDTSTDAIVGSFIDTQLPPLDIEFVTTTQ